MYRDYHKLSAQGAERALRERDTSRIGPRFRNRALELLDLIHAAADLRDFAGVADFHPLKGNRAGTYSTHVNGNWCITFKFVDGEATDLNFEDYH